MIKDYNLLVQQTLKALRKKLSQEQVNRKIKAHSNQLARWESGHAKIDWVDFCDLCEALKIPLKEKIRLHLFYEGDIRDLKSFLSFLTQFAPAKDTAKRLKISKSSVSRIFSGRKKVTLDFIFILISERYFSLTDFITSLTFPQIPPLVKEEQQVIQAEKNLHYQHPWIAALVLYLWVYDSHSQSFELVTFLSKKLARSKEEIRDVLIQLEQFELIKKTKNGYIPTNKNLNVSGDFQGAISIRKYWNKKCG